MQRNSESLLIIILKVCFLNMWIRLKRLRIFIAVFRLDRLLSLSSKGMATLPSIGVVYTQCKSCKDSISRQVLHCWNQSTCEAQEVRLELNLASCSVHKCCCEPCAAALMNKHADCPICRCKIQQLIVKFYD